MAQKTDTLKKAIREAKTLPDSQRARDLILLRFGAYMFIFSLIIAFSFIGISFIVGLFT